MQQDQQGPHVTEGKQILTEGKQILEVTQQ
jgi:hypothetical protein